MWGSSFRKAWPRWLMAFFSSGLSSAQLTSSPSGSERGRSRSRRRRAARAAARPASCPYSTSSRPSCRPRARPEPRRRRSAAPRCLSGTSASWASNSSQVRLVVAVPAGPARGKDPGRAAQHIHGQPGIVGDGYQPRGLGHGPRLQQRVFGERHARFRRRRARRRRRRRPPVVSTSSPGTCPRSSSRSSRSLPCVARGQHQPRRAVPTLTALRQGSRAGWRPAARSPAGPGPAAC